MNIKKFKLVDEGFGGLQYEGSETRLKEDNTTVLVDFNNKYRVPVPSDIVSVVQGLKYYFLICTGLLPARTDDYFDLEFNLPKLKDYQSGFNKDMYGFVERLVRGLFITGFTYDGDKILITAKFENHDGLTFAVNTPLITVDKVPMGLEADLTELLITIRKEVVKFIEDVRLRKMAPKQYLMNLFEKDEEKKVEISSMSDEQAEKLQIEKLKEKGYVIFQGEEVMDEIQEVEASIQSEEDEFTSEEKIAMEMIIQEKKPEPVVNSRTWEKLDITELPATSESVPRRKSKKAGTLARVEQE